MDCFALTLISIFIGVGYTPSAHSADSSDRNARLQRLLRDWEAKSREIRDLRCEFVRTTDDMVRERQTVDGGEAVWSRAGFLWVHFKAKNSDLESGVLFTKNEFHEYRFKSREKYVWELPAEWRLKAREMEKLTALERLAVFPSGWIEDRLRLIIVGIPVEELPRFRITLTREEDNWVWLDLDPKSKYDRASFRGVHVVLEKKRYLPRQTLIQQPNGNTVLWTIKKVQINAEPAITLESFSKELPKGWPEKRTTRKELEQLVPPK